MQHTISFVLYTAVLTVLFSRPVVTKDSRVFNGQTAALGDLPYQAALRQWNQNACGGAVIAPRWILTAGHCCMFETIDIYLGYVKTGVAPKQKFENIPGSEAFTHPTLNLTTATGDICLIRLPSDIKFNKNVQAIQVAKSPEESYIGKSVQMSGMAGSKLQYARSFAILPFVCDQFYGPKVSHPNQQICVESRSLRSVCAGDSGSPLTSEEYGLIGLVSYKKVSSCGTSYPNVFTRVAYYYNWIQEIIK